MQAKTVAILLARSFTGKMRVVGRNMTNRGQDVALVLLILAIVLRQLERVARQEAPAVALSVDAMI